MKRKFTSLRRISYLIIAVGSILPNCLWAKMPPLDITFSAEGEGSKVEKVTVTNLTHTDIPSVSLKGTDVLRLVDANDSTGIEEIEESIVITQPILTPNPSKVDGTVIFDTKMAGSLRISIYTMGGILVETATLQVQKGRNTALIPAQDPGIYLVALDGCGLRTSIRWICAGAKSVKRISLGGAGQWGNISLPQRNITPVIRSEQNPTQPNVVTMSFNEGDVLRFEGISGDMTTIVVNAPQRSHSLPFYFYPCKDVSGNTYPIIEAGGLLWMAEDLRAHKNLKDVSIYYSNEASSWATAKKKNQSAAMVFVAGEDDIYYTYSGAQKALPEGWRLPTLGELNAVVQKLGGYEIVGDKMKRSGDHDSFRDKRMAGPDSLQLRINSKGYVNEEGTITDTDNGYILTRSREKRKALFMSIVSGTPAGTIPKEGLPTYAAMHIRGVRPAPSVYTEMISKLYSNSQKNAGRSTSPKSNNNSGDKNLFTGEVNPYTGTPYGQYYTVDHSTKQIVMDVTGQKFKGNTDKLNFDKKYFGTVFVNASNGSITCKRSEDKWIYNNKGERKNRTRLKKLCPQKVSDGTYHTLKVSYDVTVRDSEDDNSSSHEWMARDIEKRDGSLILEVFGNADQNFALKKTITLPGTYKMAEFDGFKGKEYEKDRCAKWSEDLRINEFYMKRLNLLTADFNNDNIDDVVVGFCNHWMVLDGKDYTTILAKRTFKTDCVRACVGDLDEDGLADLGLIFQEGGQIQVRILMNDINKFDDTKHLELNSIADYIATLPVSKNGVSSFLDIKFGDITNRGKSVLCLTVPNRLYAFDDFKSTFYVLDRGTNNILTEAIKFEEKNKQNLTGQDQDKTSTITNSTIAVVHTRGLGHRPDILLHNGLYRLDDSNKLEQVKMGGIKEEGKLIDAAIPSDCVAVGRFTENLPEGYEQLAYFGVRVVGREVFEVPIPKTPPMMKPFYLFACRNILGITELLTPDTTKGVMTRKELHKGTIGSAGWWVFFKYDGYDFRHGAVFPAFTATSYKNIDTRRYKFVSCQATMSEPRIKFALAAAPYWGVIPEGYANAGETYDYGDNAPSTEWATSTSQGEGSESSNGTKASLIFGYEQEHKISIFGIEIGKFGFEFETNINHEWEKSFAQTTTYTYESGCTAGRDNKVGLTMTPVWLYTYECIHSNDPDNIGTTLVCGAPSYPRNLELSETDYMLLRGDRKDIPDLSLIFTHKPGDPMSYLNDPDQVKSTGEILWSNNDKNKYSTTGSDGTKSFAITVDKENSTTTTNTFSMEMSLVGFVGACNHTVKAGFGVGSSHKWANTYTTGFGTTVTGTVPLPKHWSDVPIFDWNMCRYRVKLSGQEFPVVNYIVKNARKSKTGK